MFKYLLVGTTIVAFMLVAVILALLTENLTLPLLTLAMAAGIVLVPMVWAGAIQLILLFFRGATTANMEEFHEKHGYK